MASLNGAVIGPPAILITFLVACGVGCENAPRTVRIPATAKTTARKLMRRFMFPPFEWPSDIPRECNTQFSPRQARVALIGRRNLLENLKIIVREAGLPGRRAGPLSRDRRPKVIR